jgi:hypothetical protein
VAVITGLKHLDDPGDRSTCAWPVPGQPSVLGDGSPMRIHFILLIVVKDRQSTCSIMYVPGYLSGNAIRMQAVVLLDAALAPA